MIEDDCRYITVRYLRVGVSLIAQSSTEEQFAMFDVHTLSSRQLEDFMLFLSSCYCQWCFFFFFFFPVGQFLFSLSGSFSEPVICLSWQVELAALLHDIGIHYSLCCFTKKSGFFYSTCWFCASSNMLSNFLICFCCCLLYVL